MDLNDYRDKTADTSTARKIAAAFSVLPNVEAVALGGSHAGGCADTDSDVDVYVFTSSAIPPDKRKQIAADLGAVDPSFNPCPFWDVCDVWQDSSTGKKVDAIYWDTTWCKGLLDSVLVNCQPQNGYSTSHWYTFRNCLGLYDRDGWFAAMRERSSQPYPEQLRQAIIERNHPTLRIYRDQIAVAARRGDLVSVNHRVSALLESYFDVLFALNRALHPGEKRLLDLVPRLCAKVPANMSAQVRAVLQGTSVPDSTLVAAIDTLIADLELLLHQDDIHHNGGKSRTALDH